MASRFRATLLEGHKGCAVEVPFDPSVQWAERARSLRPGRRGHRVRATVNGVAFESSIVGRSKRFWLLVDEDTIAAARVTVCDVVDVTVAPLEARSASSTPRPAAKSAATRPQRSAGERSRKSSAQGRKKRSKATTKAASQKSAKNAARRSPATRTRRA